MVHLYMIITAVIILFMILEYFWLSISIRRIPTRILINGTRGKTTTVKILHQLLNQAGWMTFSKTTGDLPQLHYPDGKSKTLHRFGPANIKENIRQFIYTTRYKPQAMILECMALHPELQNILSHKIFRPTHIALTNIKNDHQEVMGVDHTDIVQSMAHSLTANARKFLPEELQDGFRKVISHEYGTQFYKEAPYSKVFSNIPPQIIEANWGLIRMVCEELQINSQITSSVFTREWKRIDESLRINIPHLNLEFIDLFSINDPDSASQFINHQRLNNSIEKVEILLLNTRRDRPLRSLEFLKIFKHDIIADGLWVTGKGRQFIKYQFNGDSKNENIVLFSRINHLLERIKQGFSHPTRLYGLANHQGMDYFLNQLRHIL